MRSTPAAKADDAQLATPVATGPDGAAGRGGFASRWTPIAGRAWRVLLGAALLAGLAGQLRVWIKDYGLWGDELFIAANLRDHSLGELAGRLDYSQLAPPGWLWVEKAILSVFGDDERTLKLPEVLSTLLVLFLATYLTYRVIGRWAAPVTAVLIALSPGLNRYAGELKQYAVEAALALVIVAAAGLVGETALGTGVVNRRMALVFGAVSTVAVAGSYSALIVLAGAVGGLAVLLARARRWRALAAIAVAAVPGLALGAGQVLLRRRIGFGTPDLYAVFSSGFPPAHASPLALLRWLPQTWQAFVANPLQWANPWIVLILAAAGLASLVVRGRAAWAAVIAGVFGMAIAAALVRGYPFGDRVSLYLIAPTVILVAAALDGAARLVIRLIRGPGSPREQTARALVAGLSVLVIGFALALVAVPAARTADADVIYPHYRDDGRAMLRDVAARLRPGDVVVTYHFSIPLLRWYGPPYGLSVVGQAFLTDVAECLPSSVDGALHGAKRVWYVQSTLYSTDPRDYDERVLAALASRGTIVSVDTHLPAARYALIDLTAGPDPDPPQPAVRDGYACLSVRN